MAKIALTVSVTLAPEAAAIVSQLLPTDGIDCDTITGATCDDSIALITCGGQAGPGDASDVNGGTPSIDNDRPSSERGHSDGRDGPTFIIDVERGSHWLTLRDSSASDSPEKPSDSSADIDAHRLLLDQRKDSLPPLLLRLCPIAGDETFSHGRRLASCTFCNFSLYFWW